VSLEYQQGGCLDSLSATEKLKLTRKNRGYHENGSTTIIEESAKAYWMHGSFKQVHIKARRKRLTILQIAQEGGQVPVDHKKDRKLSMH
jgi:hypothetical protein